MKTALRFVELGRGQGAGSPIQSHVGSSDEFGVQRGTWLTRGDPAVKGAHAGRGRASRASDQVDVASDAIKARQAIPHIHGQRHLLATNSFLVVATSSTGSLQPSRWRFGRADSRCRRINKFRCDGRSAGPGSGCDPEAHADGHHRRLHAGEVGWG